MSICDDLISTIENDLSHQFAVALEMIDHLPLDAKTLLIQWQSEMKQMNSPLRMHIICHLNTIGMTRTIHK